jgi:outer membrane protein OmpA-like peptidoglycan-associated protein
MSQSVERLKELLFENETTALAGLAKRLATLAENEAKARSQLAERLDGVAATDRKSADELAARIAALSQEADQVRQEFTRQVESIASIDAQARAELNDRLERLHARTGDDERLAASVAQVIADALRRAEVARHIELSQSIAPLVVTTIKAELRNSQDEMVEALYPITGRLVKTYVASAIKDLTEEMNRRLEQNAIMLRLQSLATGRSVGELALASSRDFQVKDLYLIRRGSGELIAHWPEGPTSGREHVMSGVLAAVNEFANEAFAADQSSLREIDLGEEQVYLRGSPIYLLAARCSGEAPKPIAQVLDDAFLDAVERQHAIDNATPLGGDSSAERTAALAFIGQELSTAIPSKLHSIRRAGSLWPLKLLAVLIVLPIAAWLAWNVYVDYRDAQIRGIAMRVVASDPEMTGYPLEISVIQNGSRLLVEGLAPSKQAKSRIARDFKETLPKIAVDDRINLVAGSDIVIPDVAPDLSRLRTDLEGAISDVTHGAWKRKNEIAAMRLGQAATDLDRALTEITDPSLKQSITRIETVIGEVRAQLGPLAATAAATTSNEKKAEHAATYHKLTRRLDVLSADLLAIVGVPAAESLKSAAEAESGIDSATDQFAAAADRLATVASMVAAVTPRSPREELRIWSRDHAIFFADDLDYRSPDLAAKNLDTLTAIMKRNPGKLRIVGYTDDTGSPPRNAKLAQERAERVRNDLIARGVASTDLLAIGRGDALELSDVRGTTSPNRRVQFELAFEGEGAP